MPLTSPALFSDSLDTASRGVGGLNGSLLGSSTIQQVYGLVSASLWPKKAVFFGRLNTEDLGSLSREGIWN
jgi:hypothetical protein